MGDCLLLTGPVRAIKEEFPQFRISVLVDARFADCFHGNPDFDEVIVAVLINKNKSSLFTVD